MWGGSGYNGLSDGGGGGIWLIVQEDLMSDENIGIIVGVVVLGLVLFTLIMGFRFLIGLLFGPSREERVLQARANHLAGRRRLGPHSGLEPMSGLAKLVLLIASLGLAYLLISVGFLENLNISLP